MDYIADPDGYPVAVRVDWPKGEWDYETDFFSFEVDGLPCMCIRGPVGSWNGYVGVPDGHPSWGLNDSEVDQNVHGGCTYARDHFPIPKEARQDIMPTGFWVIGFDCGHAYDLCPAMESFRSSPGWPQNTGSQDIYRNMAYVREQTEELARQLYELQPRP